MKNYDSKEEAYEDVAQRHGVSVDDIDMIPHPKDSVHGWYLSYGPEDEDVELVSWDEDD
jgi:hypothetical protein